MTDGRGPDSVIDAVGMEAHGAPLGKLAQDIAGLLPDAVAAKLMEKAGVDRLTALHAAIDTVRRGGTVSIVGVYGGMVDPMPMMTLFDKQITVRMGQANVKRWVDDILPLADRRRRSARRRRPRHPPPAAGRRARRLRDLPDEERRSDQDPAAAMSGPPLAGKVVVVTGASSGIGRATALACSRQGARVVAAARKRDALETLASACREWDGEVHVAALDVAEAGAMDELAAAGTSAFGQIDAWINNAGVYSVGRFEQIPPEAFDRVLEVNLKAVVRGSRSALALFRAQGHGVLVNVSSMIGGLPGPYVSAYATSKWAVRGFSLALYEEVRDEDGIDVCSVRPASIDTPIFRQTANYSGRRVKALTPTYPPEQAARVISGLLLRPRREVVIGRSGKWLVTARHLAPGVVDRIFAKRAVDDQFDGGERAEPTDGNLFEPDERWGDADRRLERARLSAHPASAEREQQLACRYRSGHDRDGAVRLDRTRQLARDLRGRGALGDATGRGGRRDRAAARARRQPHRHRRELRRGGAPARARAWPATATASSWRPRPASAPTRRPASRSAARSSAWASIRST